MRFILFVLFLGVALPALTQDYETPGTLAAADFLPAEVLETDYYQIDPEVENNGILNTYVVHSKYGDFIATGTPLLYSRVHEVGALVEMEAISKTDVYIEGAKEAGVSMARGVGNIFTDPVGTAKAIPTGIGRLIGGISRGVQRGGQKVAEDTGVSEEKDLSVEEDLRRSYELVNTSEREWAQKLSIDPYTSNPKMREALSGLAFVDTLGDWTTGLVATVVVPVAGLTTVVSVADSAMNDIYTEDPKELRAKNLDIMLQAGTDPDLANSFLNSGWYNPSLQTLIVRALVAPEDLENRWLVLSKALNATNEAQARFFVQSLMSVRWYSEKIAPITEILDDGNTIISARSAENHYVLFVPVDYVLWTENIALLAQHTATWAESQDFHARELVVLGTFSTRAKQELTDRGWKFHENVGDVIRQRLREAQEQQAEQAEQEAEQEDQPDSP